MGQLVEGEKVGCNSTHYSQEIYYDFTQEWKTHQGELAELAKDS